MLILAVVLILLIGIAHSYLGERYILSRMFRNSLPPLFGSDAFTKRTLRFTWHITSVAWLGFAALVLQIHRGGITSSGALITISITFAVTGIMALVVSRGRHLSWLAFGAISAACYVAA